MTAKLNREEAELDKAITTLQDLVRTDIAAFAQTSPSDENGRKLQSQIQRATTQLRARMRELELLAEEQETIEEGDVVVAVITKHKRSYEELQRALRQANLEVQRRASKAAQEQRKALMGSKDYMQRAQQLKTQQDLTSSAADTTASLQRTRQLMAEELQHTSATLAAMETSDTTLKAANKQYKAQRGTIKQSHGLLRTMRVNSIKDNLKLYTALAFFTAVVAYVGLRRMSYFVPSALVPSMPSLAAFGIGSAKGNSTAEFPAFDGQAFDTSEKQPNGASMGSAGGMRSFQSRLMWIQRQAGRFLGQATHHGRRLAVWLYGQTAKAIDSIKAKIEERQRKQQEKGAGTEEISNQEWPDPSDPAYQVPVAVYDEPASAKPLGEPQEQALQEGQPSGAHPGYAGGMEAMYGGGSMVGKLGDAAANNTTAPESHGQHVSFGESVPSSSQPETHDGMQEETDAPVDLQEAVEDPGILQPAAAAKQTDIRVAEADADRPNEPEGELTADLEDAALEDSVPVPAATDAEEAEMPAGIGRHAPVDGRPEDGKEEAVAGTGDQDTRPLMQPEPAKTEESTLAPAAEETEPSLPRDGTTPAAVPEAEDNPSKPGDDDNMQQLQAEDSMVEQGQQSEAQEASGVGEGQDGPAALERGGQNSEELPDLQPEQGASHPEGSAEEALASGGVGTAGSGPATEPEDGHGATGSAAAVGSITGDSGSMAVTELDLDKGEELPRQPSATLSDEGGDSVPEQISEQVEQLEQGASQPEGVAEENTEAHGLDPQEHLKDEL